MRTEGGAGAPSGSAAEKPPDLCAWGNAKNIPGRLQESLCRVRNCPLTLSASFLRGGGRHGEGEAMCRSDGGQAEAGIPLLSGQPCPRGAGTAGHGKAGVQEALQREDHRNRGLQVTGEQGPHPAALKRLLRTLWGGGHSSLTP